MHIEYTGKTKEVCGVTYYELKPTELIGKNVYAAKTASICEDTSIGEDAHIGEYASVGVMASIGRCASIGAMASIGAWASIGAGAIIGAWASIGEDAIIGEWASIGAGASYDFIMIGAIGSRNAYTSFWRHEDGSIRVSCGCFEGTLDEFEEAVEKKHGNNQHGKAYKAAIEYAKTVMVREEK